MDLHNFLVPPAETARRKGPHDRIVMSSRVRLARNLKEAAFPGWAKKPERIRVLEMIRDFGGRGKIFEVHFRNVTGPLPHFAETFPDDGYMDMYQVMRALRQVRACFSGVPVVHARTEKGRLLAPTGTIAHAEAAQDGHANTSGEREEACDLIAM